MVARERLSAPVVLGPAVSSVEIDVGLWPDATWILEVGVEAFVDNDVDGSVTIMVAE